MKVKNLTSHLLLFEVGGQSIEVPPETVACCVDTEITELGVLYMGKIPIPVVLSRALKVTGLPEITPGVIYIVSRDVAAAVPYRDDVFVPDNLIWDGEHTKVRAHCLSRIGCCKC